MNRIALGLAAAMVPAQAQAKVVIAWDSGKVVADWIQVHAPELAQLQWVQDLIALLS